MATRVLSADSQFRSVLFNDNILQLKEGHNDSKGQQAPSFTHTDIDILQPRAAFHQKVPPEILAKVFTYCVNNDIIQLRSRSRDPQPWILGHICSRWRQIALAEPLLWRRIDARGYSPLLSSTVSFMHEILDNRGGSAAVELQIAPGCRSDWAILLNLCSEYPSRLRNLHLTIDAWYSPPCLRRPIRTFDDLESLVLVFCRPSYGGSDIEGATAITAFSTAHHLRKVEIHREGSHNPNLIDATSFPWAQLTSLTISCISTIALSQILCECVELTDLVVGLQVNGSGSHYALPTTIHLAHLHSITIQFGVGSDGILDLLTTPALKTLIFGQWALASQKCILDLVDRSDCDLEILHYPADETPDIVPLLKFMPYLRELIIPTTDPIPQSSLDAIRIMNLSPRLRAFTFPVDSILPAIHFLQSRWTKSLSGSYEGIREAKIRIRHEEFALEEVWYEKVALEFTNDGRMVDIVLIQ
ncbi:hypothetical protein BDZ94DRAFT_1300950 [Collybia nuda]|uniref:F-box domain-containing protein n=1 Tax=Collybia nuda TaxID=64659 RepID=A0A9P5Y041_9AGAR|nr:hypothetical protein BDZ94DRAFT_1300950 [Collybia nuda]